MAEDPEVPKDPEERRRWFEKLKEDERLYNLGLFFWDYRIEIVAGFLVLIGLILTPFYTRTGSALVGLGVGICFYPELHRYFVKLPTFFNEHGLVKTLILAGIILYLLFVIPVFLIAVAIGYAVMYLLNRKVNI